MVQYANAPAQVKSRPLSFEDNADRRDVRVSCTADNGCRAGSVFPAARRYREYHCVHKKQAVMACFFMHPYTFRPRMGSPSACASAISRDTVVAGIVFIILPARSGRPSSIGRAMVADVIPVRKRGGYRGGVGGVSGWVAEARSRKEYHS
jgi:hypothetical protein